MSISQRTVSEHQSENPLHVFFSLKVLNLDLTFLNVNNKFS